MKRKLDRQNLKKITLTAEPEIFTAFKRKCQKERYFIGGVVQELLKKWTNGEIKL
jgi:hypothetical protein